MTERLCAPAFKTSEGTIVSNNSFNIGKIGMVAPIACAKCGDSAHVIQRQPGGNGREHRAFECTTCRHRSYRLVAMAPADDNIQRMATQLDGKSLWRT